MDRPDILTVDHIVPLAKGRKNKRANYAPFCGDCNQVKGDRPLS
ncbi:MAG: HNH endonuclease [Rhizobium pusense]|nr:HNH endonuclease [Agrobacterium pusense]